MNGCYIELDESGGEFFTLFTEHDNIKLRYDDWSRCSEPVNATAKLGKKEGFEYTKKAFRFAITDAGLIPAYKALDWMQSNVDDESFKDGMFVSNFWMEALHDSVFGWGLSYDEFCEEFAGVLKSEGYDYDY